MILTLLCALAVSASAAAMLAGCGGGGDTPTDEGDENVIDQPANFVFDDETGEFSFDGVENAGYYLVRVYAYDIPTETESNQYLATSSRISGGTGEKSGSVDISDIAWGEYHVNLYTYAASGLGLEAPEPVTHVIRNGGTLRKPELRFTVTGTEVEMQVDGYSAAYYAFNELLTTYTFTVYGEDGTTVEKTVENDSGDWEIDSTNLDKGYLFKSNTSTTTLEAGDYYLSVKANGQGDLIIASEESEKVPFTVTAGASSVLMIHGSRSCSSCTVSLRLFQSSSPRSGARFSIAVMS